MQVSLRHRLEYGLARAFAAVVTRLPEGLAYWLARRGGDLLHALDRRHREIGRENVREHLLGPAGEPPEEAEVRRIVRGVFRHLVTMGVEMVRLPRAIETRGIEAIASFAGTEHLQAAVDAGKGVLVVSCHVGNWEIIAAAGMGIGTLPVSVYRPLDNPLLDAWVRSLRGMDGADVVEKQGAMRGMLKALRKGRIVAILVDQDPRRHGIFVPFFGTLASTIPSPAELALRTGAAIIPGYARRVGPGNRHLTTYEAPIELRPDADHDEEVRRVTAELNSRLEAAIRGKPEQWLWLHRRWKTKPPAETGAE